VSFWWFANVKAGEMALLTSNHFPAFTKKTAKVWQTYAVYIFGKIKPAD
jgi:hypothetical protein